MSLATNLSIKDQRVLSALFGGESNNNDNPPSGVQIDMNLPPDQNVNANEIANLVKQEKEAIELVESGGTKNLQQAMEIFNQIIETSPKYASAYNNRAQVRRLITNWDQQVDDILMDLQNAIELAEPSSADKPVSKMQGTILCQAYSQLGGLYLTISQEPGRDRWYYEEKASNSLYYAGLYGNELARQVATKVNPYAKLCGNMVRDALIAEYSK